MNRIVALLVLGLSLVVCGDEGETSPARLLVSKQVIHKIMPAGT